MQRRIKPPSMEASGTAGTVAGWLVLPADKYVPNEIEEAALCGFFYLSGPYFDSLYSKMGLSKAPSILLSMNRSSSIDSAVMATGFSV